MDNKSKTGKPDDSRINLNEPYEVQYWSEKLKISKERLAEIVKATGPIVTDVKEYLAKNK